LGLSLPVVGELGVSLAVAAYEQEQKAKRLAAADDQVEEKINAAVDLALSDIDMSSTKKDIEAAARKIVKNKLDALLARRTGTPTPAEPAASQDIAGSNKPSVADMNEARQRLAHERQRAITELIAAYGPQTTTELVTRLQDDRGITASERTVRADCSQLEATGQLVRDGRRWALQMTLIARPTDGAWAELPESQPVHVNGKG